MKFTKPNGSTFDEEISHGIIIGQVSLYSPFEDLVGIALELEYDPDFFEYFETSPSGSDNFGVANENIGWMSRRSSDSTFDISRYNFNGAFELNERFSLQRFYFQRANPLLGNVPDFSEITFKNIRGWLADGTEVALGGQTVLFRLPTTSVRSVEPEWASQITLFPNPVQRRLHVRSEEVLLDKIEVVDQLGRVMRTLEFPQAAIDVTDLPPAIYYLRLTAGAERIYRSFSKME